MKLPEFRDPSEQDKPKPDETPEEIPEQPVRRPAPFRRPPPSGQPKGAPASARGRGISTPPGGPHVTSGQGSGQRGTGQAGKGINPGLKLRAFEAAARTAPPAKLPAKYRLRPDRELARRAAWDVAAVSSLVVNAILVGVLIVMALQIKNLRATMNGLLGGLYGNFVAMDQASIATTITVNTNVQLNFSLPIQQNTDVVLTQNVPIPGARVSINSELLTINNAPANVTLPAGTSLPIALNMSVPVMMTVPVSLDVPVNIPLSQTELHGPFTGLQQTILPLYCTFNKNAQFPQGVYICSEHDAPTPVSGVP